MAPLMRTYSPYRISAVVLLPLWVPIFRSAAPADHEPGLGPRLGGLGLLVLRDVGPLVLTNVLWFTVDPPNRAVTCAIFARTSIPSPRPSSPSSSCRAPDAAPGRGRSADRARHPRRAPPGAVAPTSRLESSHERTRLHADRRLGPPRDLGREREAGRVLLRARLRVHAHGLRRPRDRCPRPRVVRARAGRHPPRADERPARRQRDLQMGGHQGRQRQDVALTVPTRRTPTGRRCSVARAVSSSRTGPRTTTAGSSSPPSRRTATTSTRSSRARSTQARTCPGSSRSPRTGTLLPGSVSSRSTTSSATSSSGAWTSGSASTSACSGSRSSRTSRTRTSRPSTPRSCRR